MQYFRSIFLKTMNLIKMQILLSFQEKCRTDINFVFIVFDRVSLATIGVCIFCAFASVGALFVSVKKLFRLFEGGQIFY